MVPSMGVRAGAGAKTKLGDETGRFVLPFYEHTGSCFVSFKSGIQDDACICLQDVLGLEDGT